MKHIEFDQIYDDIKRGLLFSEFAYETSFLTQQNLMELHKDIKANHELLLFSDYFDDTKAYCYRCAVFVNHASKQIVFANAGTRPGFTKEGLSDLRADLNLMLGMLPSRFKSIKKLNQTILENIGQDLENYELVYTGHSLGGAIADLQAADMEISLLEKGIKPKKISAITFDNPGGKAWKDKLFQIASLDPQESIVEHIAINNRPNFINTSKLQAGKVLEIEHPNEYKLNGFELCIAKVAICIKDAIADFAPEFIIKILEWMSYGSINQQITEHKLDQFVDVIIKGHGQIWQKSSEKESIDKKLTHVERLNTKKSKEKHHLLKV